MSSMPKVIGIIAAVVVVVVAIIAAPVIGDMVSGTRATQVDIVGADDLEFPVNEAGETYGSPSRGAVPKLIITRSDSGDLGYVRVSELDLALSVVSSMSTASGVRKVDVYKSDGVTVIGELTVTEDMPGPRDGRN